MIFNHTIVSCTILSFCLYVTNTLASLGTYSNCPRPYIDHHSHFAREAAFRLVLFCEWLLGDFHLIPAHTVASMCH